MSDDDEVAIEDSGVDDVEAGKGKGGGKGSSAMDVFFKEVEEIKELIKGIKEAASEIKKIQEKVVTSVGGEEEKRLAEEVNNIISKANVSSSQAKKRLEQLKKDTEKLDPAKNQSDIRVRKNLHTTTTKQLVDGVRDYQQAQTQFKNTIKEKVTRQIKVVKPGATEDEIDTIVRSGDTGSVYRAAILQPGLDPVAQAYLNAQDRLKDIKKLERSVEELHKMFIDLAVLVDAQGEVLDQIEHQVYTTRDYVANGNAQIEAAMKARRSMRRKMCCLAVLVVLIMAIILGVVFNFLGLNK